MTPSLTIPQTESFTVGDVHASVLTPSFTYGELGLNVSRPRRLLIMSAYRQLRALAIRQNAASGAAYARILRLPGTLLADGAPTPQIGSNGEGGILVEWLVNGQSLTIDYEDETEILIVASDRGGLQFEVTITAWWEHRDPAIVATRQILADMSSGLAYPIPLA
ncbi:hypothetical protein AB0870_17790 [Microbacterium proteolyticum]|uniref:hypothetical protein n=1 Tax=Microbacterium proteolyticum TaxID=1572644 RepID=UPI00345C5B8D